jgi:hypothetical protein
MRNINNESLQCVYGLNTFMWGINAIICGVGSYFIINTYSGLNKEGNITNCNNVYLLTGISVGNALLSVIGCYNFCIISTLSFLSTLTLAIYNLYTIFNITDECKKEYIHDFLYFWIFYNICVSVQIINFICTISKCILLEFGPKKTEESEPFIIPVQGQDKSNLRFYIEKNRQESPYPYAPVYPHLQNTYEDD